MLQVENLIVRDRDIQRIKFLHPLEEQFETILLNPMKSGKPVLIYHFQA
jgi:hypothetical protein